MANTSLKKVSTSDIEAAIAQALGKLTEWENCTVRIQGLQFSEPQLIAGEKLDIQMRVELRPKATDDPLPF